MKYIIRTAIHYVFNLEGFPGQIISKRFKMCRGLYAHFELNTGKLDRYSELNQNVLFRISRVSQGINSANFGMELLQANFD